jgi:chromosomal replication initiator protein
VARNFRVDKAEFFSACRTRDVVYPRQIAMLLAREFTTHSLPRLGHWFGRDHSTVMHGIAAAKGRLAKDPLLAQKVESIRWVLRENYMRKQLFFLPPAMSA